MRKNRRRILTAATSLLLCAVMLVGLIPAVSAQGKTVAPLSDLDCFDFSVPWAENNVSLTASKLFDRLFSEDGLTLSEEERAYLDERLYTLTYNDTIPSDAVQTNYDKATGTLNVTVPIYSYKSENGNTASWVPLEVKLGSETKSLTWDGDAYVCQFTGLDREEDFDIDVTFVQTVDFSEAVVRRMLTQSKTDGEEAAKLLADYAKDYAAYQKAYNAYRAWIEYPAKRAARDRYDRQYAEYLEKKAEYDAYVADADSFDARVKAYEEYLKKKAEYETAWKAYEDYKKALDKYNKEYNDYTKYRNQLVPAQAQIDIMESLFVSDSHGWQLYGAILGPTVSMVLERQDEMNIAGKGAQVEAAGEATDALRIVLEEYANIRTAKKDAPQNEREAALHAYYRENYTTIKNNFRKLYEALYNLYSEGIVSDFIEAKGKEAHYQQFLGQLYITVCCLDDEEALNMSWSPTTHWAERTLDKVVEQCQIRRDNVKADPAESIYPTTVVKEPQKLDEVKPPVPPAVVHEPDVPVPVDKPTEPTFVEDPGAEPPPVAADPGAAPEPPMLSDTLTKWSGLYNEIDYEAREGLVGPRELTLTATVSRNVSVDNLLRVRFYAYDGTLLGYEEYEPGSDISNMVYPTEEETDRPATSQYVYEFAGWYRFDGTEHTATSITNDLSLRAAYSHFLCQYEITWEIDGQVAKKEMWDYGTTPVYEVPDKTEGRYHYVFSGWSPAIVPVTSNAIYRGTFRKDLRTYDITWKLAEGTIVEIMHLTDGEVPVYQGAKDFIKDNKWYAFAGWNTPVVPAVANATYTATYRDPVFFSTDAAGKSNVNVTVKNGIVTAEMLGDAVDYSNLCDFALNCGYELVLARDTVSIKFNADALAKLRSNGCKQIRFARASQTMENGTGYLLEFLNASGAAFDTDASVTVQYRYTGIPNGTPACYEYENGTWKSLSGSKKGGVFSAERTGNGIFWCGMAYYILYDPVENCNTLELPAQAVAGMRVDLSKPVNPDRDIFAYGFEIAEILVTMEDGTVLTVDGCVFEMPNGAVNITLTVERIVYHVSFVVNGTVISRESYYRGEKIVVPDDPTLDLGDGRVHSFIGWSPDIEVVDGDNREIVYTAQFISSSPVTEEQLRDMESNEILVRIILIGLGAVAVVGGVIALVVIVRRRRHR